MAFAFPLTVAQFMQIMPISEIMFDTPERVEINQTEGGEILSADLGPMLWTGEVTLGRLSRAEAAAPDVLLDILRPSGRTFYAYDTRRGAPLADPLGTILGAATPTIASLNANNREITLQALPANYVLTRGDYVAFDYGSAPVRRALHKVVNAAVQANGLGVTPLVELTPALRPGATIGTAITLIKAACKCRLVPGSIQKGKTRNTITDGMSFKFIQSLR